MEAFSALLAISAGNSLLTGEFPTQRPVTRSFDVSFDQRLNKRLSKQWRGWWVETPSRSLGRHCDGQTDIMARLFYNPCPLRNAYMWQWPGSVLVQVMPSAPSLYLNQRWLIINRPLRNKMQWNSNQNTKRFNHENQFENIRKIAAMLSQFVKWSWILHFS